MSYFLAMLCYNNKFMPFFAQDGILEELFRLIGYNENIFCVDVGAWDGIHLSNTNQFLTKKASGGLLIEADQTRANELQKLYEGRNDITCLCELVEIVGVKSLPHILSSHNVPTNFDFLSIDIDGAD